MKNFGKTVSVVLAMALLMPGVAQAHCWSPAAVTAARIKDFDTMLMVGALKCRLKGLDMIARYNRFVQQSRPVLVQANDQLRSHFEGAGGLNAYDRYATALANRFGGDGMGTDCGFVSEALDQLLEPVSSIEEMDSLAKVARLPLRLPEGACPTQISTRQ